MLHHTYTHTYTRTPNNIGVLGYYHIYLLTNLRQPFQSLGAVKLCFSITFSKAFAGPSFGTSTNAFFKYSFAFFQTPLK